MRIRLTLLLLLAFQQIFAGDRNFQIWNLNDVSVDLSKRISLGVKEKLHFTPQTGSVDLMLGDLSVGYDINSWFEMGIAGRVCYAANEGKWFQEQRPMVFGNISGNWKKLALDFSNRMEYRFCEAQKDHFRHRQMLTLEIPPFHAPWFRVYVSEEGFIRFDRDNLHLARLYTGTRIQYSRSLEMKVYYVMEKRKENPAWSSSDVVGLNMSVSF